MTSPTAPPPSYPLSPPDGALVRDVLLTPDEPGWDQARTAWNLTVDQHPAAIGIPRSVEDVVALVRFARQNGLRVAPQSTGHQASALAPLDRSLLLKTGCMRTVHVDGRAGTARAEAGAQWQDVVALAEDHVLAPLAGSAPDVGVVGYTLGGGLSWLSRRFGLAANSVLAAEVVTADGAVLTVDADNEPDLFWALRGGGGSYAIVTSLEFELHPVTAVYGGALLWPLQRAEDVLIAWQLWLAQAPDEVTSVARLLRIPELPDVPPPLRGRQMVAIEAAFIGDGDAGANLIAPLRALGPELETFAMMTPQQLGGLHMDPPSPVPAFGDGMLLEELPTAAIDNLLDVAGTHVRSPLLCVDLRHLGGAIARQPANGGAVSGIDAEFAVFAVGMVPDPQVGEIVAHHVDGVRNALGPWDAGRSFANFAERRRGGDELFGEPAHARLRAVKRAYDPDDVIQSNHPVAPA
jgi:FAD binding domain